MSGCFAIHGVESGQIEALIQSACSGYKKITTRLMQYNKHSRRQIRHDARYLSSFGTAGLIQHPSPDTPHADEHTADILLALIAYTSKRWEAQRKAHRTAPTLRRTILNSAVGPHPFRTPPAGSNLGAGSAKARHCGHFKAVIRRKADSQGPHLAGLVPNEVMGRVVCR